MPIDTIALKKFAQGARRRLLEQISARMEQVLRSDSVEIREKVDVVVKLREEIEAYGKKAIVDKVAYTWFNRFCALRFMDVNHYTHIGAVSPVEAGTQPEVLLEAKQGHIDEDMLKDVDKRQETLDLLNGRRPSSDAQGEAYRLLLVAICNYYGEFMPFMFEKIEDYTELLMPLDLLSENSVLYDLREAVTPEACKDVEVIGWLYQYYISERKDEVFEALKNNQKIEAGDIPAATQLFTPHWIVRYLVENSLGRLWMLNHPDSKLAEHMEYYIAPAQEENDFLRVASPEELRLLDPACGSGHILTYAFDLLYNIYEETGYQASDIPRLILEKNLYGIEIDPRAGALSAFALAMKARSKDRRFLTRGIQPDICVLENVTFNDAELKQYMNAVGRDLFTEPLMETLRQFEQADNFGSLIRPMLTDAGYVRGMLEGKNLGGDLFLFGVHERVLKVLKQAEFLAPRYQVVVANPPYMGGSGMNDELREFSMELFPDTKSDLGVMFIERNLELLMHLGNLGMITMQSWMFLTSYEKFRNKLLNKEGIVSMAHLGSRAFDTISGEVVSTTAFILHHNKSSEYKGMYFRLIDGNNETKKAILFQDILSTNKYFAASADDFRKIPGCPIAYWASWNIKQIFIEKPQLGTIADVKQGLATADNDRFLRMWFEVAHSNTCFNKSNALDAINSKRKWFSHSKGGTLRRWYGNLDYVINWGNNGSELKNFKRAVIRNERQYFRQSITWTLLSTRTTSFRYTPAGNIIGHKGPGIFVDSNTELFSLLGLLNSSSSATFLSILAPTMGFEIGQVSLVPCHEDREKCLPIVEKSIAISKTDWDFYETSWDFSTSPLLYQIYQHSSMLAAAYDVLRQHWREVTKEMQFLESENNRIFIEAYHLQGELIPEVLLEEITLTCNPYYRYNSNKREEELEALLLADTMKEFISYAVGCMFGRYSLDKSGLVLANQGEGIADFRREIAEWQKAEAREQKITFEPDEDNVIPVLEGEWFEDDIAERFKKFLRTTFGEDHYDENLAFIEESIGRDVRSYFVKVFYKDHVQTYKKRPIYWMFSSPKGSFNVLIYMHRYQPDTVSIVLNNYLREYIKKLTAHKSQLERTSVSGSASQSQKTKALKEITQVNKVLSELKEYEDDVLYPLATEQVSIDLDDGVKINYGKLGSALTKIVGL